VNSAAAAGALFRQALTVFRAWGVLPGVAHALLGLGVVALLEGDVQLARTTLGECLVLQQRMRKLVGGLLQGLKQISERHGAQAA